MELQKEKTNFKRNDECITYKFRFTTELVGEAILTANQILNRVPHSKTNVIPYEKWKGRKHNLKYFKVWGCLAKAQVPIPKRVNIGSKTVDCVFIGYATNNKACHFWFISPNIRIFMIIR